MSACKPVICRRNLTAQKPTVSPSAAGVGGCHTYVYANYLTSGSWTTSGAALELNPQTGGGTNSLVLTTLDGEGINAASWLEELAAHFAGGFGSAQVSISSLTTTAYAAGEVYSVTAASTPPGVLPVYNIAWNNVSPNHPPTPVAGPPFALKEKVTICWWPCCKAIAAAPPPLVANEGTVGPQGEAGPAGADGAFRYRCFDARG